MTELGRLTRRVCAPSLLFSSLVDSPGVCADADAGQAAGPQRARWQRHPGPMGRPGHLRHHVRQRSGRSEPEKPNRPARGKVSKNNARTTQMRRDRANASDHRRCLSVDRPAPRASGGTQVATAAAHCHRRPRPRSSASRKGHPLQWAPQTMRDGGNRQNR